MNIKTVQKSRGPLEIAILRKKISSYNFVKGAGRDRVSLASFYRGSIDDETGQRACQKGKERHLPRRDGPSSIKLCKIRGKSG